MKYEEVTITGFDQNGIELIEVIQLPIYKWYHKLWRKVFKKKTRIITGITIMREGNITGVADDY